VKNNKDMDRAILLVIVIVVVTLVAIQTVNNVMHTIKINTNKNQNLDSPKQIGTIHTTGMAAYSDRGRATMCLNVPPIIDYDCELDNASLNINDTIECVITATDMNNDNVMFYLTWNSTPSIFTIDPNGTMNFTPRRTAMEMTSTFQIHVEDDSGCLNNESHKEYNVYLSGGNRPPRLIQLMPNQTLIKDYFYMLTLTDYFMDPDDDPLFFFYIFQTGSSVGVNTRGTRAEIRGIGCGNTTLYYVAADFLGATATSNTVTYEVLCPDQRIKPPSSNQNSGKGGSSSGNDESEKCKPNWKCNSWSPCLPQNYSYRRCLDYNGCTKDYEQYFFQNCTYIPEEKSCEEKWECNEWSVCKDGIHTRTCMDLNNCGTNNTKPFESEKCTMIPSCFNGIQDADEEGIDCGGPCGACRHTDQPKRQGPSVATIVASIFVFSMSVTLLVIYRHKVYALYRKILGKKPKFKRKVFITEKQKDKLIQIINVAQARLDEGKGNHSIDELSIFQKEYFKQLLSLDAINKQELLEKILKLKDKELEQILVMFYAKITNIVHMRNKGLEIKDEEIQALIDEASHEIFLIAEFTDQDAINSVKDRTTISKGELEKSYNNISTLYIALKFSELIEAKNIYADIIKVYDKLSTKDKSIIYTDTIRAFHAIKYLEKQYKS
jgi:hypothetical protein